MTATKEPGPRWNGEPGEQSPSADSVAAMLPPFDRTRIESQRQRETARVSAAAARELDALIDDIEARSCAYGADVFTSREWDRRTANELAASGWDVEYLAQKFGLAVRQGVAA